MSYKSFSLRNQQKIWIFAPSTNSWPEFFFLDLTVVQFTGYSKLHLQFIVKENNKMISLGSSIFWLASSNTPNHIPHIQMLSLLLFLTILILELWYSNKILVIYHVVQGDITRISVSHTSVIIIIFLHNALPPPSLLSDLSWIIMVFQVKNSKLRS